MSYILEALKKAEEKQEREELPRELTFSGAPVTDRKKRPFWPYLLLAALVLNAGVLSWWGFFSKPAGPGTQGQAGVLREEPPVSLKEREGGVLKQELPVSIKERDGGVSLPPVRRGEPPVVKEQEKAVAPAPAAEPRTVPIPSTAEKASPPPRPLPEPPARAENRPLPPDRVLSVGELPAPIRSTLPEFRISGHAYSPEPHTRVTRVNEKILQEGQDLAPGLKVEEIIPEGVIFSYQGYRFRVSTHEGR